MIVLMKKRMLSLFALLLVTTALTAQNSEKAKTLLNEVSAKVNSYENITLDFKYTLVNTKEGIQQETRGTATMEGEKYVLQLMGATRMFDGTKVYTISPEDEEVTISTYTDEDEAEITPSKVLTFYQKGYSFHWDITQNVNGRKIQYVLLKPITESDMKEILLGIDSETKHIHKVIQKQRNGTHVTITIHAFKTNQPLPKSLFTFDASKYEDYYINRLD